jgi:integrase
MQTASYAPEQPTPIYYQPSPLTVKKPPSRRAARATKATPLLLGRPTRLRSPRHDSIIDYVEQLFKGLKGECLLIAALSYGLGTRLSEIARVRIRDVTLRERLIVIGTREYPIPEAIYDDLREQIHDTICGSIASSTTGYGDYPLFSEHAFEQLRLALEQSGEAFRDRLCQIIQRSSWRSADLRLRVIGWFHRRSLSSNGLGQHSPIDLFDKGPRIVRRLRGGALNAYYLWRADRLRRFI